MFPSVAVCPSIEVELDEHHSELKCGRRAEAVADQTASARNACAGNPSGMLRVRLKTTMPEAPVLARLFIRV